MSAVALQYLSPGTYIREDDESARLATITTTAGAAVYESKRGPLGPTFYASGKDFLTLNGQPDPSISFAHDCVPAFLTQSNQFWGNRVVNGALYAGFTYFIDRRSVNAPGMAADGSYPGRVLVSDYLIGATADYTQGANDFYVLSFNGALVPGNTFTLDVSDGQTLHTLSVSFATSHAATLTAIAQQLSVILDDYAEGGTVEIYQEQSSSLQPSLIFIRMPAGVTLVFNAPTVAGGATQPVPYFDTEARLFDVIAENPGEWADDVGVKITGVDVGTRQRFRMTFSGPLQPGASFSCYVNGVEIGPVNFASTSDSTMAAIANALQSNPNIESATVEVVPGASDNDRNIDIVASFAAPGGVSVSGAFVTGGVSPPIILIQETLKGVAPSGQFYLEVYNRSNVNLYAEHFLCSLASQVDGTGTQLAIDQQVNITTNRSDLVRVIIPDYARDYTLQPTLFNGSYVIDKTINWLTGGDDGAAILNSQINAGWQDFSNRDKIKIAILINCGYTDPSVQQEMVALAEYRYDCFAVLDMPSDMQQTQDAYNYRMLNINIDSSYGALYTPDLLIEDDNSNELRYIPPSGHVAAAYAYTDHNAGQWFAPAGLINGKLANVQDLRVDYELGDRELLNPVGVNCIINKPGYGPTIWGEQTLQLINSVLSSVHARRLLNLIEVTYADGLDYTALFQPNNAYTQFKVRQLGQGLLQPLMDAGALYAFDIVCDNRNNTDDVIDQDILAVDIYLQIVRTAKRILLTAVLTPTGASFAELIAARSNASTAVAGANA